MARLFQQLGIFRCSVACHPLLAGSHGCLQAELPRRPDGGCVALDTEDLPPSQQLPEDAPVLILLPGLTGGSEDSYVQHAVVRPPLLLLCWQAAASWFSGWHLSCADQPHCGSTTLHVYPHLCMFDKLAHAQHAHPFTGACSGSRHPSGGVQQPRHQRFTRGHCPVLLGFVH